MVKKISSKEHWENNMDKESLMPYIKAIENFSKTEFYNFLSKYVSDWENIKTFYEIWAAPWLYGLLFNKYFNYIPWWIEYTDSWYNSIIRLTNYFNIDNSNYIKWDFFSYINKNKFDLVFSWWFIEHFDNYYDVIIKHVDLVKNWWKIIIAIPNYHFFFRTFQELLYPWLMTKQHNLKIMNIKRFTETFKNIEENNSLLTIEYVWWYWIWWFWQLVSRNKVIQKFIYLINSIFEYTFLYKFFPKEYSNLIVVIKKK